MRAPSARRSVPAVEGARKVAVAAENSLVWLDRRARAAVPGIAGGDVVEPHEEEVRRAVGARRHVVAIAKETASGAGIAGAKGVDTAIPWLVRGNVVIEEDGSRRIVVEASGSAPEDRRHPDMLPGVGRQRHELPRVVERVEAVG